MKTRPIQFANRPDAEKSHATRHFVLKQFKHADNRGLTPCGERITLHSAEPHQISANRKSLYDVGTTTETAIYHHPRLSANGVYDFGQRIQSASAMVELTTTMVRNVNPVDPVIDGNASILGGD